MEAILLGSAAAEGVPALFCGCARCAAARAAGGKDIRARTALYLPPDVLVDFGPDSLYALHRFGLDWSDVSTILFTHSHADHLIPQELDYAHGAFAHARAGGITVYGNDAVRQRIQEVQGPDIEQIEVRPAWPFEEITLPGGHAIPIRSHHRQVEQTLNYLITRGGRTLLYACDLGSYDDETWNYLSGVRLDGVLMECTFGLDARPVDWPYHMGLPDVVAMKDRLHKQGTLDANVPFIITHFSHNGVLPYDDFQAVATPHGITVAYDGMRLVL